MRIMTLMPLGLAVVAAAMAAPVAAVPAPTPDVAMLPERTLRCTLGHALNIDASKFQSLSDIRHDGAHEFVLHLPATPQRQVPPEPTDDPEPIAPGTRVVADPDGIAADMKPEFYRVVDLWPQRVEMISLIAAPVVRLIIVSDVDAAAGTANLFTTRTVDAGSLDLQSVYQGPCTVTAIDAVAVSPPPGRRKGAPEMPSTR